MIKSGRLASPYKGIGDCFTRVVPDEGVLALWCSNGTNVLRYIPTQAFNFMFKDYFKRAFKVSREWDGYAMVFAGNIVAGGAAGVASSVFTYPLDYARTRPRERRSRGHIQRAPVHRPRRRAPQDAGPPTESSGCTAASASPRSASSSTAASTSAYTTRSSLRSPKRHANRSSPSSP
jgi:hypothetical protein